jgi:hypothetical protein
MNVWRVALKILYQHNMIWSQWLDEHKFQHILGEETPWTGVKFRSNTRLLSSIRVQSLASDVELLTYSI